MWQASVYYFQAQFFAHLPQAFYCTGCQSIFERDVTKMAVVVLFFFTILLILRKV
jgi:hypothetical protein